MQICKWQPFDKFVTGLVSRQRFVVVVHIIFFNPVIFYRIGVENQVSKSVEFFNIFNHDTSLVNILLTDIDQKLFTFERSIIQAEWGYP